MNELIAIIPVNDNRGALGPPSLAAKSLGGKTVLEHVLHRVDQIRSVNRIVLLHASEDASNKTRANIRHADFTTPIEHVISSPSADRGVEARAVSRKWAANSWRGGLGGGTVYDELLPAAPIAEAMTQFNAPSALLVGSDWPFVDPAICDEIAQRHLEHADAMKLVFSQAPPGLAGIAVHRTLIENMASNHAGFGQVFGYVPSRAQADPIGLDVCVQIPPAVRRCAQRFIYDTPRSVALMDDIATGLGDTLGEALAIHFATAAETLTAVNRQNHLPHQVTLELTPQRPVSGPITPHHYASFDRPPINADLAMRIVEQIGDAADVTLSLGGLGDALHHPDWQSIVQHAHETGVTSIAIETDLQCDEATLDAIIESPIDIVSIRLNADTAAVYERTMGSDAFGTVVENIQRLMQKRAAREPSHPRCGLPWIVPRLIKTADTLGDMETFFDRWFHFAGHAVIEPATTGRSKSTNIMPAASPVAMAPPKRIACRQIDRRMSILSNGFVSSCDQDWHGQDPAGDTQIASLLDIWQAMDSKRESHQCGKWDELNLCAGCSEWHRP